VDVPQPLRAFNEAVHAAMVRGNLLGEDGKPPVGSPTPRPRAQFLLRMQMVSPLVSCNVISPEKSSCAPTGEVSTQGGRRRLCRQGSCRTLKNADSDLTPETQSLMKTSELAMLSCAFNPFRAFATPLRFVSLPPFSLSRPLHLLHAF